MVKTAAALALEMMEKWQGDNCYYQTVMRGADQGLRNDKEGERK